ncbi:hypothetical protein N431DRAFT_491194 [Stipitochalara longipes BDJ]|nr:hypothetical protein N431DRAFT_491194 [Stipitochalara longipes BDJ]
MFSAAISRVKRVAKPLRRRKDKRKLELGEETQPSGHEPEDLDIGSLNINDNLDINDTLNVNDSISKDQFNYGWPLKERNIRLLQLHSGAGDDPIVCSMMGGPLNGGSMPFEAVSYVWGSEENPRSITCNWAVPLKEDDRLGLLCPLEVTNNMKVTENLYHLLLRLRLRDGMRTLWIDQICIDQDKNPEKLQEKMNQVRMMAEVYSAAENVLIWLGEEDSETATAFGMLEWSAATEDLPDGQVGNLLNHLSAPDDMLDQEELDAEGTIQNKEIVDYLRSLLVHVQPTVISGNVDPEHPNRVHITLAGSGALKTLLERPWFTRTWTFQEAISAKKATIMCGPHRLPWEILYRACKSMQTRRIAIGEPHNRINLAFVVETMVKKGDLQRDWARLKAIGHGASNNPDDGAWLNRLVFHNERKIKRLLPLLRPTACKDPRDKVLALLGIAHDDYRWIVFPDYKWPVVNIYTCIVSYWIQEVGKMDISFLNHVQDSNPEHGLPSWVPDWSTPAIARPLIDLADFSAAGDTVPEVFMDKVDFLDDLKPFPYFPPIVIEGFFILKVQDVEPDLTNYERQAEMLNRFENLYPMTELSYLEAYRRTVYPNILEDFVPPERAKGAPSFWEYINNHNSKAEPPLLDSSSSEYPTTTQQRFTARELQSKIPNTPIPLDDNCRIQYHTRAPAPGRALFVSTTGFIGLCPKNTLPGDNIYIFLGGATPFVIRVLDDEDVKFVGECFVLGLMHGEAVVGRPKQRVLVIMR